MAVRPPSSKPPAAAQSPASAQSTPPSMPVLIPQGAHAGKPGMPLHRPFILIGSRNRAHVHLVSHTVSRAHAAIVNTAHGSYIRDLGSRTHTFVNGRPVKEAPLHHSDALQCGSFQFRFSDKVSHGPLESAPRAPRAVVRMEDGDVSVAIEGYTMLIGSRPTCDLYLNDPAVSMAHAIVFELNGRHYVRDLGSRTGTLVNDHPAHQEVLEIGDEIRIGPALLRYASADEVEAEPQLAEDDLLGSETIPELETAGTAAEAGVVAATAADEIPGTDEFDLAAGAAEPEPIAPEHGAGEHDTEADTTTRVESPAPDVVPLEESAPVENLAPAEELIPVEDTPLHIEPALPAEEQKAEPAPAAEYEPLPVAAEPGPDPEPEAVAAPAVGSAPEAEQPLELEPAPPPVSESEVRATAPTDAMAGAGPLSLSLEPDLPPPLPTPAARPDPVSGPPPLPFPMEFEARPAAETPAAEQRSVPLDDLEPSLADLEALIGPGEPAPLTGASAANAFDLDLVPTEPEQPVNLTADPFGPLTDLDLMSHFEPSPPEPVLGATASAGAAHGATEVGAPETDPPAPAGQVPPPPEPVTESGAWAEVSTPEPTTSAEAYATASELGLEPEDEAAAAPLEPVPLAVEPPFPADITAIVAPGIEPPPREETGVSVTEAQEVARPEEAPADVAPAEIAPIDLAPPEMAPPEEPSAPEAEVPLPEAPPEEAAEAEAFAPLPAPPEEEAAPAKRPRGRGRKGATPKAPPKPDTGKKKKPWGRKGKAAAEAEAAAAAETASAAAGAAADVITTANATAAEALAAQAVAAETAAVEIGAAESVASAILPADAVASVNVEPLSETDAAPDSWQGSSAAPAPTTAIEETVAATEPTPESAQSLGAEESFALEAGSSPAYAWAAGDAADPGTSAAEALPPDPAFDHMLEELSASPTGAIIEEPPPAPLPSEPEPFQSQPSATGRVEPTETEPTNDRDNNLATEIPLTSHPSATPPVIETSSEVTATTSEAAAIDELAELMPVGEPPADLSFTTSAAPPEAPEVVAPLDREPSDADPARAAPPAPVTATDQLDEPRLEDLEALAPPPPAVSALEPSPPAPSPPAPAPPPARPAFDPFRGMGRDEGSFIGGMPLNFSGLGGVSVGLAGMKPAVVAPPAPPPRRAQAYDTPAPPFAHAPPTAPAPAASARLDAPPARLPEVEEPPLDLTLPDLPDAADLHLPPEPGGTTAPDAAPFDAAALDLPDLPPAQSPKAAPPPRPTTSATALPDVDGVDPLAFTEAEAPTLELLPRPQAPPPQPSPQPAAPPPARGGRGAPAPTRYPAKTPPPARAVPPRRSARSSFEGGAADLGADFDIPPFTGKPGQATGAGTPTSAFNGLAMPPVREADVFSGLTFGTSGRSPTAKKGGAGPQGHGFGGDLDLDAALNVPPAPHAGAGAPATSADFSELEDADAAALGLTGSSAALPAAPVVPPAGRRIAPPAGKSPRGTAAAVPAGIGPGHPQVHGFPAEPWRPDAVSAAAPRRRLGIGLLVVLMGVLIIGAGLGIWFYGPKPGSEVVGSLQFDRLKDLTEYDRRALEQQQRDVLLKPSFRLQAREILKVADPSMPYGLLGEEPETVKAYDKMVESARVRERTNNFVLYYRGNDPTTDRARMQALLKALYAQNGTTRDKSATVQSEYDFAQKKLKNNTDRIEALKQQIASLRDQGERVPQLEQQVKKLQADDQRLRVAAQDAERAVRRLQADLDQLESLGTGQAQPPPQGGGAAAADDANGADLVLAVSGTSPADQDPQVRQWRQQLNAVAASLSAARAARNVRIEQASKSLDAALEQFNTQVQGASQRLEGDSQLRRYVAAGQKMQEALRKASADLAQQQKTDRDFLNEIKRRLAAKSETQLKAAWARDDVLRRLEEDLALKERHRNAAIGGGLRREAAGLESQIVNLGHDIETRREILGSGRSGASEVQELQDFIDRTLKRMEEDRARNDKRMEELLAGFAAAAPAIEKLPEGQKKLAAGLEERSKALAEARRQYTAAVAEVDAAADAELAKQEQQGSALRSRIDARVRQVAQAATREKRDDLQEQARQAKIQSVKTELAAAQQKVSAAQAARDANYVKLSDAQSALATAKQSADKLATAQRERAALEAGIETDRARVESLQKEMAKAVRPVEPGEDAVSVNPAGEDRRPLIILVTSAGIVMAFGALMWLTAHGGEVAPPADRATYDVLAGPGEGRRNDRDGPNPPDDEQPLTV